MKMAAIRQEHVVFHNTAKFGLQSRLKTNLLRKYAGLPERPIPDSDFFEEPILPAEPPLDTKKPVTEQSKSKTSGVTGSKSGGVTGSKQSGVSKS